MTIDDKLDQLLKNVRLVELEPDSDGGNNSISVNASQVPFIVTVGSPIIEPLSGTGLALDEGSN